MKKKSLISTLALTIGMMGFSESIYAKVRPEVVDAYVKIQEALVADDLDAVKKTSKELQATVIEKSSKLKSEVKELSEAKTIKAARNEFKDVSSIVIKNLKDEVGNEYFVAYCPMAGAKWIQKKGEIANPYMSKDMQKCGEKI